MQIISNITTPHPSVRNPSPASENRHSLKRVMTQARTVHPYPTLGEAVQQCALNYKPRLVGQIGPSGWGRKNTWAMNEISGGFRKCWLASMCYICIYIYICIYLCIYVIIYFVIYVFISLCVYIYVCVCVCLLSWKIDKYDDVWWFSRKPYLISGGYGTKWNVLVAIIQHQMQEKFLELGLQVLHHITVLTRWNPLREGCPTEPDLFGHIWTSCVWQAGYKS